MFTFRIGLRLMLLLALLAALLLGWWGVTKDVRRMEAELSPNADWVYWGQSSGALLRAGMPTMADVRAGADMEHLMAAYNCSRIEYLSINSKRAFQAFQPPNFPAVKKILLSSTGATADDLARLADLRNMTALVLIEFPDPARANPLWSPWLGLAKVTQLRHLLINADSNTSFDNFPVLPHLRTLTIKAPLLRPEELAKLKERLPNCLIVHP